MLLCRYPLNGLASSYLLLRYRVHCTGTIHKSHQGLNIQSHSPLKNQSNGSIKNKVKTTKHPKTSQMIMSVVAVRVYRVNLFCTSTLLSAKAAFTPVSAYQKEFSKMTNLVTGVPCILMAHICVVVLWASP